MSAILPMSASSASVANNNPNLSRTAASSAQQGGLDVGFGSGLRQDAESRLSDYKIIRRNGSIAPFTPDKISIALTKAFIAVNGGKQVAVLCAIAILMTVGVYGIAATVPGIGAILESVLPTLILASIQVNIRAGELPPAEDNGVRYLKLPIDVL